MHVKNYFALLLGAALAMPGPAAAQSPYAMLGEHADPSQQLVPPGWTLKSDAPASSWTPSEEQIRQGWILWTPDWLRPVTPDLLPREADLGKKLQAFATRDEFEPIFFAIRSLKQQRMTASITELRSPSGGVIPSDQIELRNVVVQRVGVPNENKIYSYKPAWMEKFTQLDLPANGTMQLRLLVHVPQDTAAGMYSGKITLSNGDAKQEYTMQLRVLPFALERRPRSYGPFFMGRYYSDPVRSRWLKSSPEMLKKIFAAYHHYGLTSIQFYEVSPRFSYADGKLTADYDEITRLVSAFRAAGNDGAISLEMRFTQWFCDELSVVLDQKYNREPTRYTLEQLLAISPGLNRLEANLNARWSAQYVISERTKDLYRQALTQLFDVIRKNGWKNIYLLPEEELGNGGIKLWGFEQFAPVMKEFPDARIVLVDNMPWLGVDSGHKYNNYIDIRQYNTITQDLVSSAKNDGKLIWYYNRGWSRAAFGLPIWKLGSSGTHMWADQWTDLNPFEEFNPKPFVWLLFYPSSTGPLPVVSAEQTREGIDDLGYVDTLEACIARAESKPDDAARQAAQNGRKLLEDLSSRLPLTNSEFTAYHESMTSESALNERWRIAAEILKIRKVLGE